MKSFSVISAFNLSTYSLEKLENGFSAFESAVKKACSFPHCDRLLVLSSSETYEKLSETLTKIFEKEEPTLAKDGKTPCFEIQKIQSVLYQM